MTNLRPPSAAPMRDALDPSLLTHELRAPLSSIHSALCLLREREGGKLDPDSRQMVALAIRNAERLAGLINDVLDYQRLDAGRMPLRAGPVSPRALLRDAAETLQSAAISKGVRLVLAPGLEPLPRVLADRGRAAQILVNLLSNAIKFTPAGGRVEAGAAPGRFEHAGTVVFWVKDAGPGVAPEDRERIFRPFEQARSGEARAGGSGLGLAIARMMAELHGGRVWAESWPGLGSTFRLALPAAPGDLARPVQPYPEPVRYHGLLVGLFRRLNAVLAYFFV